MLINADEPEVVKRAGDLRQDPLLSVLLGWSAGSGVPLAVVPEASGLELRGTRPVEGRDNRCLLKVFRISERRCAAFFYKRSQVPFSRDRFAYGAVVFDESRSSAEEAETWFRWVDEGFHPEAPPKGLRRAFNFDVPD